jgi:Protein of unknown function (DUF2971)
MLLETILNDNQHLLPSEVTSKLNRKFTGELLYHYTDARALESILRNGEFWANDARFMNDPNEIYSFQDRVSEVLDSYQKDYPFEYQEPENTAGLYDHYIEQGIDSYLLAKGAALNGIYQGIVVKQRQHLAVCLLCLSEKGDQLSQWRGYCPEGGYVLGLSSKELKHHLLLPCIYKDEEEQKKIIKEIVDDCLSRVAEDTHPGKAQRIAFESYGAALLLLSHIIKPQGFSEEAEWRLIFGMEQHTDMKLDFRPKGNVLTPFYRWKPEGGIPLRKIIVGATPRMEQTISAVQSFLTHGSVKVKIPIEYGGVQVEKTKCDYQYWG